ncbi:MAG: DUF3179 domain-containing protein [Rhizobiaceae bacterium]
MRNFIALFVFGMLSANAFAEPARWKAEGWKTDFSKFSVKASEILSGGPPKDGIPPIETPSFTSVKNAKDLADTTPVIGLSINGDARAYPLRVMIWHEIANDIVGGKPVVITYCPLCNAAIVFDAEVDGKALTFGTTGKLRNSDLIMYDRATESWWQQFIGTGIAGKYTDKKLKLVPSRLEAWGEFKKRHPNGKVLVPNNENMRSYGRNPYVNYDISAQPFLYNGSMPEGIPPMARVVVVRRDNKEPLVITMAAVRKKITINTEGLQISWKAGQASALHTEKIASGRDVGTISVTRNGKDVAYDVTFAFVAHAFHPKATIRKK